MVFPVTFKRNPKTLLRTGPITKQSKCSRYAMLYTSVPSYHHLEFFLVYLNQIRDFTYWSCLLFDLNVLKTIRFKHEGYIRKSSYKNTTSQITILLEESFIVNTLFLSFSAYFYCLSLYRYIYLYVNFYLRHLLENDRRAVETSFTSARIFLP